MAASALRQMRTAVVRHSTGNMPVAVSEHNMMASAASSTALATSVISARVGRGFVFIDSRQWRATTHGFPATLHFVRMSDCASATLSGAMSIPRVPRASMMPSDSSMMSSNARRPSAVSIFAMMRVLSQPSWSSRLRSSSMSERPLTCDVATKSIWCVDANSAIVSMSRPMFLPCRRTPTMWTTFRSPIIPLLSTTPVTFPPATTSTRMPIAPSRSRIITPGDTQSAKSSRSTPSRTTPPPAVR
mmetsp:Transcript_16021/g.47546  ORF Transcript_16021/g.47546 Transcript_16021/m.47546 type:complete len:244 (-) Transcript_16021:2588-3319(-)